ncbi:hypothetical protein JCM3775_002129 [Rhodotorula graminis]
MAIDSPAASQAGKHPRLASLARTNDLGSPARGHARQQQQLGAIGGRAGPGYSPYARRVATRAAAQLAPDSGDDDDDVDPAPHDHGADEAHIDPSPVAQSKGLFGKVRSLPGRMLGMLSRSSSSKQLAGPASSSSSLAQVRAELDQVRAKDTHGMSRSHTSHNLAAPRLNPLSSGPAPLPASSSMSALSTFAQPQGGRSSHSTLRLPPTTASTLGSGGTSSPSFLTAANLGRHSTRAASPAPSTTASLATRQQRNRSPSPLRTGLAGSMSAFQLAQPPSPTSASAIFNNPSSALGSGAVSNPFGLSSRSPFAPSRIRPSPSVGAGAGGSIAGFSASSAAGSTGHPLFPYASTLPRGTSPGLTSSFSLREGLSSAASASGSAAGATLKRPYARAMGGSPLGPRFPLSGASVADVEMRAEQGMAGGSVGGAERARKKQLVWDPVQGLVSRERLEKEKAAEAPALPKNEAERILEVLEGMGRTPLGDAKRASVRSKHVNVPATSLDSGNGRLARSSTTPSILSSTPYAARSARLSADSTEVASSSSRPQQKGLQAVLRAREERRRALLQQEREERERERAEDAERERVREQRRRDRRRRMDELAMMSDDGEGDTDVFSAGGSTRASRSDRGGGGSEYGERDDDDELRSPRRVTRSAAKKPSAPASSSARDKGKGKDRLLEPPTPSGSGSRRSTRASSRTSTSSAKAGANAKSPSPAPTPRKSSRSARVEERDEQDEQDEDDAEMTPAPKRTKAKSPGRSAPPKSPSPAPPVPSRESSTAPATAKISFPAPSSFPSTAPSTASGRSSLRPGKNHSSRKHETSAKVFSAKEEDLPPLDDDALSKIQMPFPANFSFGPGAGAAPTASADDKKKDESAPASGSSLLSRLGAPPPSSSAAAEQPKSAPAFSFGAPTAKPAAPPVPSFSFQPSSTTSTDKKDDKAMPTAAAAAPAASDFFAKPSPAPPKPSFSFGDAASSRASSVATDGTAGTGASKPNFFANIVKDKEGSAPPPVPAFSFGAAATAKKDDDKATKPTEVGSSTSGAANPNTFVFGTPVAQPVKETKEDKGGDESEAAPSFSFGNLNPKPVEKKVDEKNDAPPTAPFAFGAAKPATASSSSAFSFGASSTSTPAADKPAASTPFGFGSPAPGAATSGAPAFQFGTTPATPQAEDKKDAPSAPTFGASLGPTPVPAATTDEAGDSGMEDEGSPAPPNPAPAPSPFAFGASSGGSGAAASLFGKAPAPASGAFSFGAGAAEKKEPASPFGGPATSTSTGPSLFGGAASASKPAFSFGNGASPSPSPAPPSPAPAAVPSFNFGAPQSSANGSSAAAAPSFTFGAPAQASNVFGSSTSSAPAAGFGAATPAFQFGAGASPSPAPASPAPAASPSAFSFGAPSTAPAMGSTLSNGAGGASSPFAFGQPAPASQPTTPGAAPQPPFAFGAPAPSPGAGAGAAAPFAFGVSTPGAAPPMFGAPAAANGAGGPFTFGAQPAAAGQGALFNMGPGGNESSRPFKGLPRRKR